MMTEKWAQAGVSVLFYTLEQPRCVVLQVEFNF